MTSTAPDPADAERARPHPERNAAPASDSNALFGLAALLILGVMAAGAVALILL